VRRAIRLGLIPADCKLVIHGHSHLQRQQHLGGIRFVTVGPLHSHPSAGCITIDSQNDLVSTVAY
jgi:predicted phosphodiesterase